MKNDSILLKRAFLWLVITAFIFGTILPVLATTIFKKEYTIPEEKTVEKSSPKYIETQVCYINKNGNNYHYNTRCSYVNENSIRTTEHEAVLSGYNMCLKCDNYPYDYETPKTTITLYDTTTTKTIINKEVCKINYLYPIAICTTLSFIVFVPLVLFYMIKRKK